MKSLKNCLAVISFLFYVVLNGSPTALPSLMPNNPRSICDQRLEEGIQLVLKNLKEQGYSAEKLADARLYMDLVGERYKIQVDLLVMDRTAFSASGLGARLRAPFVVYGDCKDDMINSIAPIDFALSIKEHESPCKKKLREEIKQTLNDLSSSGLSSHVLALAKYYISLVEKLQIINLKLVTMDRISFPLPSVQGQFQDPFIPYEQCRSVAIVDPLQVQ